MCAMTKLPRVTISLPSQEVANGLQAAADAQDKSVSKVLWPSIRKIAEPHIKKGGNRRKGDRI